MLGVNVFIAGPIVFSIVSASRAYDVLSTARYVGWRTISLFEDRCFQRGWQYLLHAMAVPMG